MRHLPLVLCVAASCGFASSVSAGTSPLVFTLDLMAPCNAGGCTGIHPSDISLDVSAGSFTYSVGSGTPTPYIAELDVATPLVCDEISSALAVGPATTLRFAPTFTNAAPGGLLE